jgi:SAM-dependent methyltransferase
MTDKSDARLPPPGAIRQHYDDVIDELGDGYIRHRWGESETQRRHYAQTRAALVHALSQAAPLGIMAEIGCGPAVWTDLYLRDVPSALLCDISKGMLDQARTRVAQWDGGVLLRKVEFLCGDFLTAAFPAGHFDTILSVRAFEYVSDKRAFVAKCFSSLRPGGRLLVVTKNKAWYDQRRDERELSTGQGGALSTAVAMQLDLATRAQLSGWWTESGFQGVRVTPVVLGSYHRPLTWPLGLAVADFLHALLYRRSAVPLFDFLTESFLVVGRKPA